MYLPLPNNDPALACLSINMCCRTEADRFLRRHALAQHVNQQRKPASDALRCTSRSAGRRDSLGFCSSDCSICRWGSEVMSLTYLPIRCRDGSLLEPLRRCG